jgi:non-ribosomal peptide synthetase component F
MRYKKFPLSSPQREIWFDQILHENIPLYNRARYIKVPGIIKPALLEQAINFLIKKYDTLRTHLTEEQDDDGTPLQTYVKDVNITVPLWDFSTENKPDDMAIQWMQKRADEPFLLTENLLCRYDLIKTHKKNYYILMQYHHLIVDGFSMAQLGRSLAEIYTQLAHQKTPSVDTLSYTRFINYDRAYIDSKDFDDKQDYWLTQYKTAPEPLLSPYYRDYYSDKLMGSHCDTLTMPRSFYQQLKALGKQQGVTFFRVFLATLYVYFTQTGQRDDFAVGYPTLNRPETEFKQIAGLFTLVGSSHFNFGRDLSFAELLQKIHQTLKENLAHQPFPNSEIKRAINQGKSQQASVLFDISVSYQRFNFDASFDGIESETTQLLYAWEQTPLMIHIQDFNVQADVKFHFVYNLAYFKANEIKELQVSLLNLFKTVINDSTTLVRDLPIISKSAISKLQIWNNTSVNYPDNQNFITLFENQTQRTPDNIALVFEQNTLSYQQLNQQANQVAHYLANLKKDDGTILLENNASIVIAIERSLEMLITLLAIFKIGAAYIPVDPNYPRARIRYMLEDSAAPLLLTQSYLKAQLPLADLKHPCLIQCVDEINFSEQASLNLEKQTSANDLAYVIYTSGSTGKPKGVMVEQYNLANFLQAMQKLTKISEEDKLLAVTTLSFDIAALELYLPLISGSCLYLGTQEMANDAFVLQQQLETNNITIMQATPATWQLLKHSDWQAKNALTILCGGEALPTELSNYLLENSAQLWNVYGPTETTVWSSAYQIKSH